jgi:hypothetical protein
MGAMVVAVVSLASCSANLPTLATGILTWPQAIDTEQRLAGAVPGWAAFEVDEPAQLTTVGVFEGYPGEQGSLEPDEQTDADDGLKVATWQLTDNGKRHYWIACFYDHTRFALARPIASKVSTVVITSNPNITVAGLSEVMSVTLK